MRTSKKTSCKLSFSPVPKFCRVRVRVRVSVRVRVFARPRNVNVPICNHVCENVYLVSCSFFFSKLGRPPPSSSLSPSLSLALPLSRPPSLALKPAHLRIRGNSLVPQFKERLLAHRLTHTHTHKWTGGNTLFPQFKERLERDLADSVTVSV